MDFLATPGRRRVLFAALYLSEGAPIGFIWLALPTELRARGVPIEKITWLTALLVLPWTFKFLVSPLVDVSRTPRFTFRSWVFAAQTVMVLSLVAVPWVGGFDDVETLAAILFVHAMAAATQDVAIDGLCISVADPSERGRLNGWMQAGMMVGRASMGGGALLLMKYVDFRTVTLVLAGLTASTMILLLPSRVPEHASGPSRDRLGALLASLRRAIRTKNTWLGLVFALVGGAAFKSLEVVLGPFLIDRGFDRADVGWFSAGPMIGLMLTGAVAGGILSDRFPRKPFVMLALFGFVTSIGALAVSDWLAEHTRGAHLLVLLSVTAFAIGVFTAASYALFMDLTDPSIAATQFSAFMGATNGCESWSTFVMGKIVAAAGYPTAMLCMCAASLCALPALCALRTMETRVATAR